MRLGAASALALALAAGCASRVGPSPAMDDLPAGVPVPGPARLALGSGFSCGVEGLESRASHVSCWGRNAQGQLGREEPDASDAPLPVLGTDDAVGVVVGEHHACALADGWVTCWGLGSLGQTGTVPRAPQETSPEAGSRGELPAVLTAQRRVSPTAVHDVEGAVAIAAGAKHTCALLADGRVRCWGYDHMGQVSGHPPERRPAQPTTMGGFMGAEEPPPVLPPTDVAGLPTAVSIAAGGSSTCMVDDRGGVHCWGLDPWGVPHPPTKVEGLEEAVQVVIGRDFRCALQRTGAVWCWGTNRGGQVGDGTFEARETPVRVVELDDALQLTASGLSVCALRGEPPPPDLTSQTRAQARRVAKRERERLRYEAMFPPPPRFTAAQQGAVSCWGLDTSGQLGRSGPHQPNLGSPPARRFGPSATPVAVIDVAGAIEIASEGSRACALFGDGAVRCWGSDAPREPVTLKP